MTVRGAPSSAVLETMMTEILERVSIGLDAHGQSAMRSIKASTHLGSSGDVTRASLTVMFDLLTAEDRGFEVEFVGKDGSRWRYSPHRPSYAVEIRPSDPGNNVTKLVPYAERMKAA
jgi:hypothetical protein